MESDIGPILRKRKLRFREALLLVGELKAVVKADLGPWQVCVWTLWILWQSWALLSLLSSQQEAVLRKSYCWSVLAGHLARNNTARLLPPVGSSLESWLPVFGLALFSPPLKCCQSRAPHSPEERLSQACLRVGDSGKASSRWRWNTATFSAAVECESTLLKMTPKRIFCWGRPHRSFLRGPPTPDPPPPWLSHFIRWQKKALKFTASSWRAPVLSLGWARLSGWVTQAELWGRPLWTAGLAASRGHCGKRPASTFTLQA